MVDRISPERRSWNMSRIRGRDTGPERHVRSILHTLGCRFRLHSAKLPGKPDVVLPRHRSVVVVHGCFWHRHRACRFAYTPKSNVEFWAKKFAENVARDRRTNSALRRLGWRVIVVWECELSRPAKLRSRLGRLLKGQPTPRNPATP
jgi:DNA mismatch endonuclease, patch repair protein